ncbi:hypothetical protein GCM10027614_04450 [Micromonospora vulcania]
MVTADGRSTDTVYWRPEFNRAAAPPMSAGEWQERIMAALRTAVRRRMVADVPVGVLLSGGIDSSLIVALLAEQGQTGLATFSIGFEAAAGRAATSSTTRTWWPAASARTTSRSGSVRPGSCPPCTLPSGR